MSVIHNLHRDYGNFKLSIPYWELSDQGTTVLWGPSGSGKSTIFRLLTGIEELSDWSWIMNGIDLAKLPIEKRQLGVVFQNYDLFPHLSAEENILFAAEARKVLYAEARKVLQNIISILKLDNCIRNKASLLSGGEKQRVALARAIIGKPRLLLLDEPFSSLDEELRAEARSLVKSVISATQIPALLITHDRQDVELLGDHVVKINNGMLV